jgi:nitrate/nitrite transporter NarK
MAAEGTVFARCSTFFRSLFSPCCGKTRTKYQVRKHSPLQLRYLAKKRQQRLKPSSVLGPCGTVGCARHDREIGALGGSILPNLLGFSRQYTGSYRTGFIVYAMLAVILVMLRGNFERLDELGRTRRARPDTACFFGFSGCRLNRRVVSRSGAAKLELG